MSITFDVGWLLATLLLSVRVAGAFMLVPVLGPSQIPTTAKVVVVLALSAVLVEHLPAMPDAQLGFVQLVVAGGAEALLGAAFAFGFLAAYGAAHFAGRALDIQMGFGAASVLNPTTQTPSPLLGSVLGMVAVLLFLSLDGHHVLIRLLVLSAEAAPVGDALCHLHPLSLLQHSTVLFTFGFALAAPVMFALLLADVAMAVMARSMPQLNVFVLSFSLKIVMGLCGLAFSIVFADSVFIPLFERVFRFWVGLSGG